MRILPLLVLIATGLRIAQADDKAAGRWEGLAQIPGRELTLIVDLAPADGGKWHGALTIPGLNVKGAALSEVAINESNVSFVATKALAGQTIEGPKVEAHFSPDGALSGELILAGNRAAITLHKIGPPDIEPPRKSTPIAPELAGEWRGAYEFLGYPRTVTLKLTNRPQNGATADFVIVGKKVNTIPVDLVTQTGDFLTVDSRETGLTFEGRCTKDAIDGTVLQGPLEMPVKLTRAR